MSDTLHTRQIEWTQDRLRIPNITDRNTVVSLAKIANDAYIKIPRTEDWLELNSLWNVTNDFGWEENGIRGHVFANKNNNSVIIGLKGTSPPSYSSGTGANDKSNVCLLIIDSRLNVTRTIFSSPVVVAESRGFGQQYVTVISERIHVTPLASKTNYSTPPTTIKRLWTSTIMSVHCTLMQIFG